VVGRGELTDQAWAVIEPLLPPNRRSGGQWADHRRTINGILWRLRTGAPWRDLPERYGPWQTCYGPWQTCYGPWQTCYGPWQTCYGPWQTCYERFRRWQQDGTWDRLLACAQTKSDAVGQVEWTISVDATINRAHQHAAGARHRQALEDRQKGRPSNPTNDPMRDWDDPAAG